MPNATLLASVRENAYVHWNHHQTTVLRCMAPGWSEIPIPLKARFFVPRSHTILRKQRRLADGCSNGLKVGGSKEGYSGLSQGTVVGRATSIEVVNEGQGVVVGGRRFGDTLHCYRTPA